MRESDVTSVGDETEYERPCATDLEVTGGTVATASMIDLGAISCDW